MKLAKKEIKLLRKVLGYIPKPYCAELHHTKKNRHCMSINCPVEVELRKNIEEAYRVLDKIENSTK
jgi:hypothetical protein